MAMEFDATNLVACGNDASLTFSPNITMMGWIKPDVASATNYVMVKVSQYFIRQSDASNMRAFLDGNNLNHSGFTFVAGEWSHVAFTYDGTDGKAYQDGVLVSTVNNPGITMSDTGEQLNLASPAVPSSTSMDGTIDDPRVYNRALSDAEILTIFTLQGRDRIIDGLVYRALLNENAPGVVASGAGSVKDVAPGQSDGTPATSPVYRASILAFGRRVA